MTVNHTIAVLTGCLDYLQTRKTGLGNALCYDKKAAEWINRYLQLVRTLHEDYAAQLPAPLAAQIAQE